MLYIQIEQTLSNNDGSETIATRCSLLSENANKEQKHKKLRSQGKCGRDCPSLVGGRPAKSVVERPRGFKSHIPRFFPFQAHFEPTLEDDGVTPQNAT